MINILLPIIGGFIFALGLTSSKGLMQLDNQIIGNLLGAFIGALSAGSVPVFSIRRTEKLHREKESNEHYRQAVTFLKGIRTEIKLLYKGSSEIRKAILDIPEGGVCDFMMPSKVYDLGFYSKSSHFLGVIFDDDLMQDIMNFYGTYKSFTDTLFQNMEQFEGELKVHNSIKSGVLDGRKGEKIIDASQQDRKMLLGLIKEDVTRLSRLHDSILEQINLYIKE